MPGKIHQVRGIIAVVNGKGGIEPDLFGIHAQQPGADAVESPGPGKRHGRRARSENSFHDPVNPLRHFRCCPARKSQQQNAVRVNTAHNQMRDPMGERVGLARPRAGDNQQGGVFVAEPMLDRPALIGVQFVKVCRHLMAPTKVKSKKNSIRSLAFHSAQRTSRTPL